jgi:hypothetical protein
MHKLFYLVLLVFAVSCAENLKSRVPGHEDQDSSKTPLSIPAMKPLPEKVIGERVMGTITLLDTVNGKKIATLDDNFLLNAGVPEKGWMMAGIETDITEAQEKAMLLKKGQKLLVKGTVVGEALIDIPLEATAEAKDGSLSGTFYGYLPAMKIKPKSVIETALGLLLIDNNSRKLADLQLFMRQFQLQPTGFNSPFLEYANYESTVDDPSPAYRMVLVFYKNELFAVVDSRKVVLQDVTEVKLDRGFHGYFFEGTDPVLQQKYILMFNEFINSVD